jgi:hypothetical protein
MALPLCKMVPMPVVKLTLKIDILKMEQAFHMGYKEGDKIFNLFMTSYKSKEHDFFYTMEHGMNIGSLRMSGLKKCCETTQTWCASLTRFFLCGIRTIGSKLGCHTLTYCTMLIHPSTYL